MASGSVAGKFEEVQKNDYISYLPGSAESVKALKQTQKFPDGDTIAAIVVLEHKPALTKSDQKEIKGLVTDLTVNPIKGGLKPQGPILSKNGSTALVVQDIKQIPGQDDSKSIKSGVEDLNSRIDKLNNDLDAKVTGPAGISYDAIKVFNQINGTLLFAAAGLVFILLILIYRSPIFWIVPFMSVIFAEGVTRGIGYGLAEAGVTINGQTASIMSVLVFGAGTDYALLLVARYREELRHHEDRREAIQLALRRAAPAIVASGSTVIAGLLCLMFAEVNGTRGLGPIGAVGVGVAMLAMLTLLPALLALLPRGIFYPFVPRPGDVDKVSETRGFWHTVGAKIERRPRTVWVGMTVALGICALGLTTFNTNLTQADQFVNKPESIKGQDLVEKAFPAGISAPTNIVVPNTDKTEAVVAAVEKTKGVSSVGPVERGTPGDLLTVSLDYNPYSEPAYDLIGKLRSVSKQAGGKDVLVGGPTAVELDVHNAANHDSKTIPPIVLVVVFVILAILLRAIVAPLLLVATVLLSFAATVGISAVVFKDLYDFPGSDTSFLLFAFIFLVALGVDYNIFLMARTREESERFGTREGMLRSLSATGSVITSAGIVLAGTFFVLATLPIVPIVEIGFAVGIGVLLDTFLVRSILVPALVFDIGKRIWWPSSLAKKSFGGKELPGIENGSD